MSQKSYNNTPCLYLVPTPIGNLEDITIRAVNTLKEVDIVFSEDTRETGNLLKYLQIKKKLIAAHEHNEDIVKLKMVEHLKEGKSLAFVTDRGTPIISDPGYKCVSYVIEEGFNVIALPGATALIPALITSGLPPHPFLFYGFLNNKVSKKRKELEELKKIGYTFIIYESPHRLQETLSLMKEVLGDRQISIAREISKTFEEIYRGKISDIINELAEPKGEIVIVIDGNKEQKTLEHITNIEHINMYVKEGMDVKQAIKMVAKERKINKSDLYKEYHVGK